MRVKTALRQIRPRAELINKTQFTEAYDIIPKSSAEISGLDMPDDKKKALQGLFDEILSGAGGMPDPIALQAKTPKNVKVFRGVADNFDLPALSKKYGLKVTAGDGSRGGRGAKSSGFAFEDKVTRDIDCLLYTSDAADEP